MKVDIGCIELWSEGGGEDVSISLEIVTGHSGILVYMKQTSVAGYEGASKGRHLELFWQLSCGRWIVSSWFLSWCT